MQTTEEKANFDLLESKGWRHINDRPLAFKRGDSVITGEQITAELDAMKSPRDVKFQFLVALTWRSMIGEVIYECDTPTLMPIDVIRIKQQFKSRLESAPESPDLVYACNFEEIDPTDAVITNVTPIGIKDIPAIPERLNKPVWLHGPLASGKTSRAKALLPEAAIISGSKSSIRGIECLIKSGPAIIDDYEEDISKNFILLDLAKKNRIFVVISEKPPSDPVVKDLFDVIPVNVPPNKQETKTKPKRYWIYGPENSGRKELAKHLSPDALISITGSLTHAEIHNKHFDGGALILAGLTETPDLTRVINHLCERSEFDIIITANRPPQGTLGFKTVATSLSNDPITWIQTGETHEGYVTGMPRPLFTIVKKGGKFGLKFNLFPMTVEEVDGLPMAMKIAETTMRGLQSGE